VIPRTSSGDLGQATSLVADAHAIGLIVHPWTFRRENFFLPQGQRSGNDPAAQGDMATEIKAFIAVGIDGIFSDHVADTVQAMQALFGPAPQ
jgi:glycerophosphoryl diester phosphodiesterase